MCVWVDVLGTGSLVWTGWAERSECVCVCVFRNKTATVKQTIRSKKKLKEYMVWHGCTKWWRHSTEKLYQSKIHPFIRSIRRPHNIYCSPILVFRKPKRAKIPKGKRATNRQWQRHYGGDQTMYLKTKYNNLNNVLIPRRCCLVPTDRFFSPPPPLTHRAHNVLAGAIGWADGDGDGVTLPLPLPFDRCASVRRQWRVLSSLYPASFAFHLYLRLLFTTHE